MKTCCFIGHRKIVWSLELENELFALVKRLIVEFGVTEFLFGSKSEFNNLCHKIVTELKGNFPHIFRVFYSCKSESCVFEEEREKWERILSNNMKKEVHLLGYEKEVEHKTILTAGKASYIERNYEMIDKSDICVFYYNKNYLPEKRKQAKRNISCYQPNSGTKLAYIYAQRKKKQIINVF